MEAFFCNKFFAGPMVKVSTLPFRLTTLEYGADAVFGPATSAESLLSSHIDPKDPNHLLFGSPDNSYTHFRSSPKESNKLIFQILAHDPATAVRAVELVAPFSAAIDLNCGCPETFATEKGNGSALMKDPEIVSDVLKALRRNFNLPLSVKHRIFDQIDQSIQFSIAAQNAGANGITIHGRKKEKKHSGPVAYDEMKLVFEHINVAKIGNGGIKSRSDGYKVMNITGCDSVMISSHALKNPSVFAEVPLNPLVVARKMIEIAQENGCYDRREWRYPLTIMLSKYKCYTKSGEFRDFQHMQTLNEVQQYLLSENPFPS